MTPRREEKKMERVISVITSLIGCVTLFVKTFFGKSQKRERGYYEKVLKPYVLELSKNKKLSTLNIVKGLVDRKDDDIPKYIFYLLDNGQEEKLNKVRICDYWSLYPNDNNTVYKVGDGFMKLWYYGLIVGAFYFMVCACLYFVNGLSSVISLLNDFFQNKMLEGGLREGVKDVLEVFVTSAFCLVFGIGATKFSDFLNEDRYEIKTKRIIAIIEKRVKKYDKLSDEFII